MPPRTLLIGLILGTLLGSALGYTISTTMLKQSDPYTTLSAKETQITQLNQQISNKNSQIETLQKQILSLKAEDLRLIAVSFPRARVGTDNLGKHAWGIYGKGCFAGFYDGYFFWGKFNNMEWKAQGLFGLRSCFGRYTLSPMPAITTATP